MPLVKLRCKECKPPFGGDSSSHTKVGVTNLFPNFTKSHIMSVGHAKNYCRRKGSLSGRIIHNLEPRMGAYS